MRPRACACMDDMKQPGPPSEDPAGRTFVDESKERDYVLVAVVIAAPDLAAVRGFARSLVVPWTTGCT